MFSRTPRRRFAAVAACCALAAGVAATPGQAATQQDGLVNVSLTNTNVQVPIGVAADVCNVAANVLATSTFGGNGTCSAASRATADNGGGGGGGNTHQSGLVNVSLTDTNIQVPVGVAANVCDVAVNVIAANTFGGNGTCTAVSRVGAA